MRDVRRGSVALTVPCTRLRRVKRELSDARNKHQEEMNGLVRRTARLYRNADELRMRLEAVTNENRECRLQLNESYELIDQLKERLLDHCSAPSTNTDSAASFSPPQPSYSPAPRVACSPAAHEPRSPLLGAFSCRKPKPKRTFATKALRRAASDDAAESEGESPTPEVRQPLYRVVEEDEDEEAGAAEEGGETSDIGLCLDELEIAADGLYHRLNSMVSPANTSRRAPKPATPDTPKARGPPAISMACRPEGRPTRTARPKGKLIEPSLHGKLRKGMANTFGDDSHVEVASTTRPRRRSACAVLSTAQFTASATF